MPCINHDGESFYFYAMELFLKTGHVVTSAPEFINHSPKRFFYFDNKHALSFSGEQRSLFMAFNNVSRLFSNNECAFFSLNLLTKKAERSQVAHDIHTLIHSVAGSEGTICLHKFDDEVMLSFIGYGYQCILSDWYPMDDDFDQLLARLDVANISIDQCINYFEDMVYALARRYYLVGQTSAQSVLPTHYFSNVEIEGIDREELNKMIEDELATVEREYGNDYVRYCDSVVFQGESISVELDMILLEMDVDSNNTFGEITEEDNNDPIDDNLIEEENETTENDESELNEVDPKIFRDPILMVKWLRNMDEVQRKD